VPSILDAVRRPLLACALVVLALCCAASVSAASEPVVKRGDRGDAVRKIQQALDIPADGVFGPQTERSVKRFQRSHGLTVDGIVGPQTRAELGLAPFGRSSVERRSSSVKLPRVLRQIAQCESGGNPRAVSSSGRYRGKYQFTLGTWRSVGGNGDPVDAPESLQDRLALRLYRRAGTAPWPSCA
jgi:peptidoglycan hydrolase-like protein with peptidoglycan-binding domain